MKIDRLIGIIAVLQQNKKVTAPYLAKRFEVSRRTINRDIEDICRAGIPIVTTQGKGGGISIMEGFNLNTAVFTTEELQAIFAGLKSIDSVSRISYVNRLAGKIAGEGSVVPLPDNILIDLSSHYKDSLASKIELLRKAISQKRLVRFHYYYSKGEADKLIEPYLIVFKWSNWYVFGFCTEQQDFRMYKLNRLWDLIVTETGSVPREIPEQQKDFDSHMTDNYIITAVFDSSEKYRLIEEYGPGCYTGTEDGRLLFQRGFTNMDHMISWLLGFGDRVEVIEPAEIRERLKNIARSIQSKYG
ncbi:MAG TPA: YafY family transcriptional regulator [Clostridiaceae bacterium]|mgnify:FL=1|nr:YafY family transcriptional regulator [Clostridiaceae bacterium]